MQNSSSFSASNNARNSVEVTLTPMGDKIQYRIGAKLVKSGTREDVSNLNTLSVDDDHWNLVFGGARGTKRFMKTNKKVRMVLLLSALGLDDCEVK